MAECLLPLEAVLARATGRMLNSENGRRKWCRQWAHNSPKRQAPSLISSEAGKRGESRDYFLIRSEPHLGHRVKKRREGSHSRLL